ncbi:glutamate-5-semialdehyde dehydrogenase [Helicobacter fennelliae]|uniref:Gamma-glutamyl phosphate reductase n=1 Tax=Helicobacter fennelliae MRY12-0050 TaxID=1325130 RepID=T1DUK6_9HELI|nr:glutamate-5-semialdehyde dehydrogenase [Helicobacter fennelliae]GAD17933.1 gamma-glutamyl phosphate reductase [Helicobacter fennelliae MRY12-0050]STP07641.1 gamma-glutamyl phosphate reductase [Helicobacter fennelliae]
MESEMMLEDLQKLKQNAKHLAKSALQRNEALTYIAHLLNTRREEIKAHNQKDLINAMQSHLSQSLIDRLRLEDKQIDSMIKAIEQIALQDEVIGEVISGSTLANGMRLRKVKVPLGVVGMIYESRPNVTIDAAALCIKSGNGVVLRGGKEAIHSNAFLAEIIQDALSMAGLPREVVYFLADSAREKMITMLQAKEYIDVVIPRGGEGLIDFVLQHTKIPVIMHNKGVCHIYVEKSANLKMALEICLNAKISRPSACNAVEAVLVHREIATEFLPLLHQAMQEAEVLLKGCAQTIEVIDIMRAEAGDFGREFNDKILAIKIVQSTDEAIAHINTYGSGHSEAIITENYTMGERFVSEVDSAVVYINASTRFSDGGEFGLGAEIGISTQKLHARGPMGAQDLCTSKYIIHGDGQVRV